MRALKRNRILDLKALVASIGSGLLRFRQYRPVDRFGKSAASDQPDLRECKLQALNRFRPGVAGAESIPMEEHCTGSSPVSLSRCDFTKAMLC